MPPEHSIPSITIFGGEYNAKLADRDNVVATFVPPMPAFSKLVEQNNTLLIGPRGSGKTTLLKMLRGPYLETWTHPRADKIRDTVRYSGVFIAADRTWAEQLRAPNLDGRTVRIFARAAFTLHCLRALVATAALRVEPALGPISHRRVEIAPDRLDRLARSLVTDWAIGRPVADFDDLRTAILQTIIRLGRLRSEEASREPDGRGERLAAEPALHLDLLPAALMLIEQFNDLAGEPDGRWALLFDEIEIVPTAIKDLVMSFMRGSDERLLFKISYAPYEGTDDADDDPNALDRPLGPQAGQDYSILRLTYANKREGFAFSQALLEAELKRRDIHQSPHELLGETMIVGADEDDDENEAPAPASHYAASSAFGQMLAELRDSDASFREYLADHKLDIDHAEQLAEERRALIRKIMPLVALRVEYRRREGGGLRSRQNVRLYAGAEAFYAIMEANPRWLKHVCDRLLDDPKQRIAEAKQSRILRDAAEEFTGYLRVVPVQSAQLQVDDAPKRLLARVAEYFRSGYLREHFTPDPPGSFYVDDDVAANVVESLRALINRGALIQVPARNDPGVGSVLGKRFRLAYLVAPLYGLPLRLDKATPLSKILRAKPSGQLTFESEKLF